MNQRAGVPQVRANHLSLAVILIPILFALATSASLHGQGPFTRIYGPDDQDVPAPQFSPVTGKKDTTALQAIKDFMLAAKVTSWPGIRATGTFTIAGNQETTPEDATLTIAGDNEFRLDVKTPNGTRSIRLYGPYEEIQEPDGTKHSVPFLSAAAGLLAFPKLLASAFSRASATVRDDGLITISGITLRRITLEQPLFSGPRSSPNNTSVLDLYFDPTTHLLIKSAVAVPISWDDNERYLEVTTYGKYSPVDGVLIPFTSVQTLNGQPLWTLQLSSVQSLPTLDSSYFHF